MTVGVVVMAYGSPASLDDLDAYYTHIRHGRPPAPELVANLRARYEAIGGVSPLRRITEAQVEAIGRTLGDDWLVALGHKHAPPFIEDAVEELTAKGVDQIIGVVLAPHYSRGSIGEYADRVPGAVIMSWHDLPEWRSFHAEAVRAADPGPDTTVVFTAHSLPERVLVGDPYADQLTESAAAIAEAARLGDDQWCVAWQSAGKTPDPWRGPDILEVIDGLETPAVLVCPQGFTADGLEILYDLDIQAAAQAADRGIAFARTRSVNDDPAVMAALASRIRRLIR